MVALITERSGGRTRRCDKRCYDGKHQRCRCICGGANHGQGLEMAMSNTRQMVMNISPEVGKALDTIDRISSARTEGIV